jgi:hypothetical protein
VGAAEEVHEMDEATVEAAVAWLGEHAGHA